MWLAALRIASLARPFLLTGGVILGGIALQAAGKAWYVNQLDKARQEGRADCREAQLRQNLADLEASKNQEIEGLKNELERRDAAWTKMDQEVRWARHYVSKQEAALERYRAAADDSLGACLDMRIDADLLRPSASAAE